MQIIVAKSGLILQPTKETFGIMLPQFIFQDPKKSKIFSLFDKSDLFNFKSRRTTAHYHKFGIMTESYKKNNELKTFYKITSYGVEGKGKVFVSGIEAIKFPFYGFHFQPELLAWDRIDKKNIFHSIEGIKISQKIADFFIQECKKSPNLQNKEKDFVKLGKINIHSRNIIKRAENYYWFYNAPNATLKKGQILKDWRNRNKDSSSTPKPKKKKKSPKVALPPSNQKSLKTPTLKKNAEPVVPPSTVNPVKS
jgi:hypothetical protein